MKNRILSSLASVFFITLAASASAQATSICPPNSNYVVIQRADTPAMIIVRPENEKENLDGSYIATYDFKKSGFPIGTAYRAHCSQKPYAPKEPGFQQTVVDIPKDKTICILETEEGRKNGTLNCF